MPAPRALAPHHLFFPAALVVAAGATLVKAAEAGGALPAALPVAWHGHEMLFGVAYAVIGGYLLPHRRRGLMLAAFAAWLAGRVVLVTPSGPPGVIGGLAALMYPLLLFVYTGLPFLKAAKSGRNAAFAVIIAAIAAAQAVFEAGRLGLLDGGRASGLLLAADGVFLLLFAMGGRIIAGVTSGARQARALKRVPVAQKGLEAAGLLALLAMAAADAAPVPAAPAGLAAGIAGIVVVLRLAAWRVWQVLDALPVALLHLGYLWLGLGLLAKAAAQGLAAWPVTEALHVGLVGGFGTLALTMMMRTALQRARLRIALPPVAGPAIGLVALAALARAGALLPAARPDLLWLSAGAWTAGVLLVLAWMLSFFLRRS